MESGLKMQNNIRKAFKSLLNGFNFLRMGGGLNAAYNRLEVIQDMIKAMPPAEREEASSLLVSAKELLYRHDETDVCHLNAIHLLLDGAAHIALHCPTSSDLSYSGHLTAKSR